MDDTPIKQRIKTGARSAARQIGQAAEGGKERVARRIDAASSALHGASQHLRDREQDLLAGQVDRVGSQIESLSDFLRNQDIQDMIASLGEVTRRQPVLMLCAGFGVGLLLGRILRSGAEVLEG